MPQARSNIHSINARAFAIQTNTHTTHKQRTVLRGIRSTERASKCGGVGVAVYQQHTGQTENPGAARTVHSRRTLPSEDVTKFYIYLYLFAFGKMLRCGMGVQRPHSARACQQANTSHLLYYVWMCACCQRTNGLAHTKGAGLRVAFIAPLSFMASLSSLSRAMRGRKESYD